MVLNFQESWHFLEANLFNVIYNVQINGGAIMSFLRRRSVKPDHTAHQQSLSLPQGNGWSIPGGTISSHKGTMRLQGPGQHLAGRICEIQKLLLNPLQDEQFDDRCTGISLMGSPRLKCWENLWARPPVASKMGNVAKYAIEKEPQEVWDFGLC